MYIHKLITDTKPKQFNLHIYRRVYIYKYKLHEYL